MKHIISILFICLSNMTSQAQNSPSDLNRKFVNYLTSSLSESIYLQTDKALLYDRRYNLVKSLRS